MIAIILLNYISYEQTIKLVSELQKQTIVKNLSIVIVDNCSPNESYNALKPLEQQYSNVVVLKTEKNLGYAKGNNYALYYLDKHSRPDYVLIINNDIHMPDDMIESLIERYKVLDNPAIIAPKQLDGNGNELLPYRMNSFFDDCVDLFYVFKIFHKRNALDYIDSTGHSAMKVEMIPGSFMFTSFNRFKEMGFFYPNTFLFAEERFIAVKAKQMGLNNFILLDKAYVHSHSSTINTVYGQTDKYRLLYESWIEFTITYRKHGKIKSEILRFLMKFSLFELRIVTGIKKLIKK